MYAITQQRQLNNFWTYIYNVMTVTMNPGHNAFGAYVHLTYNAT